MRKLILVFSLLLIGRLQAQQSPHSILISAGGEGGLYTLGYEYQFGKAALHPYLHAGISAIAINQHLTVAFPLGAGALYRKGRLDFMAGAGIGPNLSYYYQEFSAGTNPSRMRFYTRLYGDAGMRYAFHDGRYSVGIRYTPFVSFLQKFQLEHWGAVTFGIHLSSPKS